MDSTEVKPSPTSTPATAVKAATPQVAEKKAEPKTTAKQTGKAAPTSAKPAPQASSKTTPKSSAKTAASPKVKAASKVKAEKPVKEKKPKLVRDSFTIPKAEYVVLADMKLRAGKLSRQVKKSELIRAGIKALAAMPDSAFLAALKAVPAIKTGRPSKD